MGDYLVRRIRFSGDGSKRKREPEDYGGAAAAARAMPRRAPESYVASTPQPCPSAALHAPPSHRAPCLATAPESYVAPPSSPSSGIPPSSFLPWNMDDLLHELVLVAEAEEEEDEEMFADHLEKELAAAEDDEDKEELDLEMPEYIEKILRCSNTKTEDVLRFITEDDD